MRSRTDLSTDLRSISDRSHLSDLSVNGAKVKKAIDVNAINFKLVK